MVASQSGCSRTGQKCFTTIKVGACQSYLLSHSHQDGVLTSFKRVGHFHTQYTISQTDCPLKRYLYIFLQDNELNMHLVVLLESGSIEVCDQTNVEQHNRLMANKVTKDMPIFCTVFRVHIFTLVACRVASLYSSYITHTCSGKLQNYIVICGMVFSVRSI